MRLWLALLLLASAPSADARSWIARSYAGLLRDADAVVTGTVGDVSRHTAAFRVDRVLSGPDGLRRMTVPLPVVRCGEPGPDGVTVTVSTCLDRTYAPGERLLLLLVDDGAGRLREMGYPERTRARLSDDAQALAARLLALPDGPARRRAEALEALLEDRRPEWRVEAARAADFALTLPHGYGPDLLRTYEQVTDLLTGPLLDRLRADPVLVVRSAAAAALGRSRTASPAVTRALLDAAVSADDALSYAAVGALGLRADPGGADAVLALAQAATDPDVLAGLIGALAPVVRTDHAAALAELYRRSDPDEAHRVLEVWVQTGDPAAADQAARRLDDADRWQAEEALRLLAQSRDRRYADAALSRLRPVECDEAQTPRVAIEAAPLLAHPDEAVPAVAAYLACPTAYVRWQAARSLAQIDLPVARAALVAQWRVETDAEVRRVIADAVGPVRPDE